MSQVSPFDHGRSFRDYTFFKMTQSTCPECLKIVQAQVVFKDNMVYFLKHCPEHGPSRALVSEDANYYRRAFDFSLPGSQPKHFSTKVDKGCPTDCGLCPSHQQHTCLPIIEITDHCNLECPVCIVNNKHSSHMSIPDFERIVQMLVKHEGFVETVTLSGGEPTNHPQFWDLVEVAQKYERVGRVSIVTNGIRIARDVEFVKKLKEKNVYVIFQMDGFDDVVLKRIRGRALFAAKMRGLDNLSEYGVATQLAFVPARGVNEHQLGDAVKLMLERDNILSLLIQPMAYTGAGGAQFPGDPLDILTIPGAIKRMEEQTDGIVTMEDFIPLPCSHPLCVSLTYLLRLDDGSYVPFPRFINLEDHKELFQQTATINPDGTTEAALHKAITDLWSTAGEIPDSEKILSALKRVLTEMYPGEAKSRDEMTRVAERQAKTIFLHHYMDRHTFDIERLMKCCHHYPQIDGRIMPACGFNMFHRGASKPAPKH